MKLLYITYIDFGDFRSGSSVRPQMMYRAFKELGCEIKLLQTLGASKWQVFTKVVLPANFGTMVNSLKVNVGLSWVGVIMGEFLVSKAGIGYLIVYGSQVFQMDLVMASVIILAVAAAVMYQGVLLLEKKFVKEKQL